MKPQVARDPIVPEAVPSTPVPDAPEETVPEVTVLPTPRAEPEVTALYPSLPLRLPSPPVRPAARDPRIAAIKSKNEKYPTTAAYRKLAELYVQLGQFQEAADAYRTEAAMYRKKGLIDAALVVENKAARYDTTVQLFVDRAPTARELKDLDTGAALEPPVGCYIGAFIDRDEQINRIFPGDNYQWHRYPSDFAELVGKPHASHFMYLTYGRGFPRKWMELCKKENVIPHIAWEPSSLNVVRDDAYLREFAQEIAELDWPVFIRFAGEMNGFWTPYHGDPELYRQKFRLVHRVLHRYAPKVATIWCVNSVPSRTVPDYYPGDDGCDWVGVNLYSTPFYDNDRTRAAFLDSPLALIDPIYRLYAERKPIAIGEYGASHMAAVDRVRRNDFAIDKMSLLYSALPRLYPRIKMVNYFNNNNLKNATAGRQLNNYNLTEQPQILDAYRSLISTPYFLSTPQQGSGSPPPLPRPFAPGQKLSGQAQLSIWVKTYVPRPSVFVQVGEKIVYAGRQPGAHSVDVDVSQLSPGRQPMTIYIYDNRKRFVAKERTVVVVE